MTSRPDGPAGPLPEALTVRSIQPLGEGVPAEVAAAARYAQAAHAPATRRVYRSAWSRFAAWCDARGACAYPAAPETVAVYAASIADEGLSASSVTLALAAISARHREAGAECPCDSAPVRAVVRGIRRTKGTAAKAPRTPLRLADLLALYGDDWGASAATDPIPVRVAAHRARAVVLLGFATALRRSELVALDVADVMMHPQGAVIRVARSKTDQEGEGRTIGVHRRPKLCPVRAVTSWVAISGITEGPLFRTLRRDGRPGARLSAAAVNEIVRAEVARLGYDPTTYGGHSLRAGLLTEAARLGWALPDIMRQSGHASVDVALRYVREGELFTRNVSEILP